MGEDLVKPFAVFRFPSSPVNKSMLVPVEMTVRTIRWRVRERLASAQEEGAMRFSLWFAGVATLAACSGPKLPTPNSADARYDGRDQAVQVMVSGIQPASAAALVSNDGKRYPAAGIAIVSGPHVLYNPPPSVGIGFGGFGFSGCCSGFGSGIGVDVPVGGPTPAEISDQYVASALIPLPGDYAANWSTYHLEVSIGGQSINLPAPAPAAG